MDELERFKRVATKLGWHVTDWVGSDVADYVIQWATAEESDKPTAAFSVKVIGRDTAEKGEETWVPLRDVEGKGSWLYGEADMIAFEQEKKFTLVERDRLRLWLEENVTKEYVTLAHQALMKVYQKDKEMKTLVKSYHLTGLAEGEMKDG